MASPLFIRPEVRHSVFATTRLGSLPEHDIRHGQIKIVADRQLVPARRHMSGSIAAFMAVEAHPGRVKPREHRRSDKRGGGRDREVPPSIDRPKVRHSVFATTLAGSQEHYRHCRAPSQRLSGNSLGVVHFGRQQHSGTARTSPVSGSTPARATATRSPVPACSSHVFWIWTKKPSSSRAGQ